MSVSSYASIITIPNGKLYVTVYGFEICVNESTKHKYTVSLYEDSDLVWSSGLSILLI